MSSGVFTEDGSTDWINITTNNEAIHISVNGYFGEGTIALEKQVRGQTFPIYENGVPITYTSPEDVNLGVQTGDVVRVTLRGSDTPNLTWSII